MRARGDSWADSVGGQERRTSEEVLLEVAQACSSTLDLESLLQRTVNAIPMLVEADRASVWFVEGDELCPAAISATDEGFARQWRERPLTVADEPLSREAIQTGRPVIVSDALIDPRTDKQAVFLFGDRTIAVIPLLQRSDPRQAIGTLFINHVMRHHSYTPHELELLTAMATMIATAIDHAWLYSQVQAERRLLQTILDRLPEAVVVVVRREEQVLITNQAANQLFGLSSAPSTSLLQWEPPGRLESPDGQRIRLASLGLADALSEGVSSSSREAVLIRDDGTRVDLLANSAPLYDAKGEVEGAVGVLEDVTAFKELDRAKDAFIATASHELKNPLASLRGYAQLLLRRVEHLPIESQDRRGIEIIDAQARSLERLVRRLLDASRVQLGRLELRIEPVDLVPLARQIVETQQAIAPRHRLVMESEQPSIIGLWDHDALGQVMSNIIENAVHYSPTGGEVKLAIATTPDAVQLAISDQGIGIALDEQPHVFEPFYRAPRHASSPGRLGLGLYICQRIVELHGGRIWVESVEGQGAAFRFTLPLSSILHKEVTTPNA